MFTENTLKQIYECSEKENVDEDMFWNQFGIFAHSVINTAKMCTLATVPQRKLLPKACTKYENKNPLADKMETFCCEI